MGWFEQQIQQRERADDEAFAQAISQMAEVVMGKGRCSFGDDSLKTKDAIREILRFYHVKPQELPDKLTDLNEQLDFLMRPSGIMRRQVELEGSWEKDGAGALLAFREEDGSAVALIPRKTSGYEFFDSETGKWQRVGAQTKKLFSRDALCFYKPFPLKKLGLRDLAVFISQALSAGDYISMVLATLLVSLIGLLLPKINSILFGSVVESGNPQLLFAIATLMVGATVSTLLIGVFRTVLMARIETKMSLAVDSATMMRVFSLPVDFFKGYSPGELASRTSQMVTLSSMLANSVLATGLTSVFSLIYIGQIFEFAPALVLPALAILLTTVVFTLVSALAQTKISLEQMEAAATESGLNFSLLSGIQKIKLAGAEKRGFARWAEAYTKTVRLTYDPPTFLKLNSVISSAISLFGSIILYYAAARSGVGVADYFAFSTAYGMVSGAFMSLAGIALTVANIKPVYQMVKPILETLPEISESKQVITRLSGGVELNNITFRYIESMPPVLENLTLKIRAGQYVAIVGKTGSGKSTLMRLLLGFETPQKGAIYYDGRDLSTMDQRSLRRKIGTVMQNGRLFVGDIYSNLVVNAPWLTLDDAWAAAELAGVAQDIREMPMGMHTVISEGSGGISGGQRQRLMIARAVASKPKILMFDEATSALDNLTQKTVSDALAALQCTRIVIAHRLSTIRQCDRIVVLENGRIMEDGTYEELLAQNGFFAELVRLQQPDAEKQPAR